MKKKGGMEIEVRGNLIQREGIVKQLESIVKGKEKIKNKN
jgi:hypothetical protein